jgi:DNA-binding MarR family transcriptional regulator
MSFMAVDRDQVEGVRHTGRSCDAELADGAGSPCAVDWDVIGAGLGPEEFADLPTEARRMALVERSARFAIEFGRWKDAARTGGIGYEHMRLLQALNFGGPAIMREIGDNLLVTPRNMTAMIDQLEQAELVARRPHPADRRATLLELTPAGKQMADSALLPRFIAMGQIFDQFSAEEQCKFYAALGRLVDVMHTEGGGACLWRPFAVRCPISHWTPDGIFTPDGNLVASFRPPSFRRAFKFRLNQAPRVSQDGLRPL